MWTIFIVMKVIKIHITKKTRRVSLTQIHELDYLNYFYEKYSLLDIKYINKISKLEIDVEDNYVSIYQSNKKKYHLLK